MRRRPWFHAIGTPEFAPSAEEVIAGIFGLLSGLERDGHRPESSRLERAWTGIWRAYHEASAALNEQKSGGAEGAPPVIP